MAKDAPTHTFVPYDANPTICRICGAVKPGLCYRIQPRTDKPVENNE